MPNLLAYIIYLVVAEIIVFAIEAFVFWLVARPPIWFAFVVSFIANSASLFIGLGINQINIYRYDVLYYIFIISLMVIVSIQIGIVLYYFLKKKNAAN